MARVPGKVLKGLAEDLFDSPMPRRQRISDKIRVKTGTPGVIIDGQLLDEGTVIELTPEEVVSYQAAGVPLLIADDENTDGAEGGE